MRFLLTAALLMGVATPALAADPANKLTLSGSIVAVTDYRFRGLSLSDNRPALQPSVTLSHASGAYATVWTSNISGFGELGGSHREVDLSAGYRATLGNTAIDGGLLYYAYPGSHGGDFEFFEPYASVTQPIGPLTAKVGLAYAPSQAALGHHDNLYTSADLALPIANTPLSLRAHVGRSKGNTSLSPGGGYFDWGAGSDATWGKFTLGVSYIDTDIGAGDARSAGARRADVGPRVVASAALAF